MSHLGTDTDDKSNQSASASTVQGFSARWRENLTRIAAIPFVFLGVGLYRAWLATFFRYGAFPTMDSFDYALFEVAIGVVSLAIAFLNRKVAPLWCNRKAIWFTALSMAGGSALCVIACFGIPAMAGVPTGSVSAGGAVANGIAASGVESGIAAVLKYVGLTFAGAGLASLILMWAEFYASMNPMRVALYHAGAIAFGEVIKWLFAGMSAPYLAMFSVILAPISLFCVHASMKRLPATDRPTVEQQTAHRMFPWKPILLMTVCTFATGFGAFPIQPLLPGNTVGSLSVTLLVFFGILGSSRWFNFNTIYSLAFPLLTIGFLLVAPSISPDPELVATFYDAGYTMLSMYIMLVLSNITYRFGVSAVWISGIERGIRYLVEPLGWFVSTYTTFGLMNFNPTAHLVVVVLLISAFTVIFVSEKGLSAKWGISLESVAQNDKGSLLMRVSDLSKTYDLTPREEEVFQLLAQGHSITQIEDELYVAHGTVKAHLGHIYHKCGVHSREELSELIGQKS